ncbi:MAG: right-handed parallel beta-helix repeat-containing protein [Lactobacillus sp.]|nr:right-handed parallel beta-helix repeat-containing protein [Lactobacillus sp.]
MMSTYTVTDYGVQPNYQTSQTAAIQAVIDQCHAAGGGQITFPKGYYHTGGLRLYSDMTLYLQSGAWLIGSTDLADYQDFHIPSSIQYLQDPEYIQAWHLPPYYFYALIQAFHEKNITIVGEANSGFDGRDLWDARGEEGFRGPMGVILSGCQNVTLKGYQFKNSANWSHCLDACQDLTIQQVAIYAGHDGFNLHHSQNILIEDCLLETGDDAFAGYDVSDLVARNCEVRTACNGARIGGHNLVFDGVNFKGPGTYPHISEGTYYTHAILKYYAVIPEQYRYDTGSITFKNCQVDQAYRLVIYDYGNHALMHEAQPLSDLTFENVTINGLSHSSTVYGHHHPLTLTFKDCQITNVSMPFLQYDDAVNLQLDEKLTATDDALFQKTKPV